MRTTKSDLDRLALAGCSVPGCAHEDHGEVYLAARCCWGPTDYNEGPGLDASYEYGSGVLVLTCRRCGKLVGRADLKGNRGKHSLTRAR
jgi:hypothetical protein